MSYLPQNDVTASISIAANATSSGLCTSNGGANTYTFQLTGTWTATLQVQITRDGSTWVNITSASQLFNMSSGVYQAANITANGIYQVSVTGVAGVRLISTAYTSGTVGGTASLTTATAQVTVEGVPSFFVVGYPTAAASADSLTNPTITQVGVENMRFNGVSWDRERNNVNSSIAGDAGTKTASFNGSTALNYDARGGIITVVCGTVSGTSPTMTIQLQWSPDGGTTWMNYGPATTAITATGNSAQLAFYPGVWGDATTATLAAFTTGATASKLLSAPLPRTFRLVYTIGGTTPSFAISGVYINYIL